MPLVDDLHELFSRLDAVQLDAGLDVVDVKACLKLSCANFSMMFFDLITYYPLVNCHACS